MQCDEPARRDILQTVAALPFAALLAHPVGATAQTASGTSPVRVETRGLVARIRYEAVLSGFPTDLNGAYKLRVTELVLERAAMSESTTMPAPASARSPPAG